MTEGAVRASQSHGNRDICLRQRENILVQGTADGACAYRRTPAGRTRGLTRRTRNDDAQ